MSAQQSSGRPRTVEANIGLVHAVAKRYKRAARHLLPEDLIQEGAIGLVKAIEKFDPNRGASFGTCAHWYIRQSIGRAVANTERTIRLPVPTIAKRFAAGELKRESVASLDKPIVNGESATLHDLIGGESADPIANLDAERESVELGEAMSRLTERERFVLRERFWGEKTLEQVGNELGVSRERIRQIEKKALGKLFSRLG